MAIVTINNNPVEVEKYGYVVGSRLYTELTTSRGSIECILRSQILGHEIVIEADLYQGGKFLLSNLTMFRAGVHMKWNGQRYTIIRRNKDDFANAYWLELENLISNTIIINQ